MVLMCAVLQVLEYLNSTGDRLPSVEHAAAFARYTGPDADSHAHEAGCAAGKSPVKGIFSGLRSRVGVDMKEPLLALPSHS